MISRIDIVINFIAFQIGWFACVLLAAADLPEYGALIAISIVIIHLMRVNEPVKNMQLMLLVTFIGGLWDSVLTSQGIFVFDSGMFVSGMAPYWIFMMWLMFSSTLTITFRWLYGRYWLSMVLGVVFGPLTYMAGEALGAVVIPQSILASVVIAAGWAILMPLFIKISEIYDENNLLLVEPE